VHRKVGVPLISIAPVVPANSAVMRGAARSEAIPDKQFATWRIDMEDLIEKHPIRVLVLVSLAFVVALLWVPPPEATDTRAKEKPLENAQVRVQADNAPRSPNVATADGAVAPVRRAPAR
jgi:hypothetical protein